MAVLRNERPGFQVTPNSLLNLDMVFVKEGEPASCVFSARNDESSRPVNACRFVLVFLCRGESYKLEYRAGNSC